MAIKVYYDASNSDGGSPFWASHKNYDRVADNLTVSSAEVEDDSDTTDWETPCVQNDVQGYVLISGPFEYYDVIVTVAGITSDIGQKKGTGRVTGGLNWRFNDYQGTALSRGLHAVGTVNGTGAPVTTNGVYLMRIANNKKTKVCSCSVAGGMQIAPNPGSLYVSTKTITTMSWSVSFLVGWSYINLTIGGGTSTILAPFGVGDDITSGRISFGEMLSTNIGSVIGGFRSIGGNQINAELVKMDEDFQDPELKKLTGEAAHIMENPDIKRRLDKIIERQSESGKHKKSN